MNQKPKHTETSPSSYAAYGYDYRYDGFGRSAQASQSAAWSLTLTEHRNSLWITDGTGNVNQYLAYMPFGESFIDQRGSNDIRFKFTGKERDAETGFDYFGARYYASDLSIWLSVDPLSDEYPSTSPFMYVLGNPIALIDPTGMNAWIPPTEEGGDWTAEAGDSPGSLARDAGISQSEAEGVMRDYNKSNNNNRSSDIMVYKGDKVSITGNSSRESSSDINLNDQLQGVPVANIPNNSQGEITQFVPDFYDNWSESDDLLASFIYGIVDDAYVYGTALVLGPDKMRHLTGAGANRIELTSAGLNTLTNFVPITKMGKAVGVGKQTLNIAEYSSKYAGKDVLKGFTPAQRGMNLRIRNINVRQNNALIKTLPTTMWGVSFTGFLIN